MNYSLQTVKTNTISFSREDSEATGLSERSVRN